jgi:phenylalanyl-tRNA synthetase beta chain
MKVSVNWLKSLVETNASVDEISHALTMAGLEVEEVTPVVPDYSHVVIAEVKSVTPHPNADKLRVTEVDVGQAGLLQIVCGAPNVAVGMRVPCALVGAKLPGIEIKAAKLRGVDSNGMLCSARELGLSQDHDGLLPLAADAPIGRDIRDYLDLNDVYLTLKLTPNRGDCLSMIGIARDLAAVLGTKVRFPVTEPVAANSKESRPIKISAPKACGQYLGRVIKNINTRAATPEWMKRRLERAGFRSISPLVDITNYLTLERGRPMHAFDLDKLKGGIDVRFPHADEEMNLLNEQHVALKPDMLLITDEAGPVAMGGVMGGLESMVTDTTTSVFFEAAYFDPDVIKGKTRALGINSDAAHRFERGVDPQSAREGIEYATRLTLDICGTPATEVGPVSEALGVLPTRAAVQVRMARVNALIGMAIAPATMIDVLKRLNCEVESHADALTVTPPSYRFDLNIEEDFIEEIARVHGYEKVPAVPPKSSVMMVPQPEARRSRAAMRHQLAHAGFQEVINYSFIAADWEADFAGNSTPVRVANPIASHMSVMRSGLIAGLIESLKNNLNRGETRLKLFEVGRCFLSADATYAAQPERLAALAYGPRHAEQWGEDKAAKADFFSMKGDLEAFVGRSDLRFEPVAHPALHPGRAARVVVNGTEKGAEQKIGIIGELHPRWQQKYDLPLAPVVFELDVAVLANIIPPRFSGLSRMQAVRRDIAVTVDENTPVQAILGAVAAQKLAFVNEFALFDLYRGTGVPAGQKSLAFRIVMQDTEKTLTDLECDSSVATIVKVITDKFGATLRK